MFTEKKKRKRKKEEKDKDRKRINIKLMITEKGDGVTLTSKVHFNNYFSYIYAVLVGIFKF